MTTTSRDPALDTALDSLCFFALPADQQVAISRAHRGKSIPVFFDEAVGVNQASGFFFGIACVFVTYKGALLNELDSGRASDAIQDFSHRLAVSMNNATAEGWSETAVFDSEEWKRLRRDAARSVQELGSTCSTKAAELEFDIGSLINPDEFRTTPAAKAILGDPNP